MHAINADSALINRSLEGIIRKTLKKSPKNPSGAFFVLRMIRWQRKAARRRMQWGKQGIHVPPLMMASITDRCNLTCKGCYARALQRTSGRELTADRWRGIMSEARELGIGIVMLLGGEPLMRPDVVQVTAGFPEMIFLIFTNGLLLDREIMGELKRQRNVVLMISMEGFEKDTDKRRGKGVYGTIQRTLEEVSSGGIFAGASLTVTRENFTLVTGTPYIQALIDMGCNLIFFEEYVPVEKGSKDLVLTGAQRQELLKIKNALSATYDVIFLAFPGSERQYGGCLAAGRGLVHISPDGSLEPCPLIPYSDTSVRDTSLREALQSRFLMTIRNSGKMLNGNGAACPLREQQEWIDSYFNNTRSKNQLLMPHE